MSEHPANSPSTEAPRRTFLSSPWLLVICVVLLFFGEVVALTAPIDVFSFVPLHRALSGVCLVLFLVFGGLRSISAVSTDRGVRQISGAVLYTAIFLAVLIALNILARRHDLLFIDTTEQQVHTLAPETVELARSLRYPLVVRGFFLGGKIENPLLRGILSRIERASDLVRIEIIDPEKQLPLLEQYGISSSNTLHLTYELPDGARMAKIIRQIDEQEIANTIKKITGGSPRTVYYLSGHGEPDLNTRTDPKGYTFLRESIEGENLRVQPIVIGNTGAPIPDDDAALIVAAAERTFLPSERATIAEYLRNGGRAVFLAEPRTTDDIQELVSPMGIDIRADVIVDQVNKMFSAGGLGVQPLVTKYGNHPIVEKFDQGVMFTTASTVRARSGDNLPGTLTELAFTSPSSWGETNLDLLFEHAQAAVDASDLRGPLSVAVAFEGPARAGQKLVPYHNSRVVVFGDRDFVSNGNLTQLFNRDLFLNAVNWTVGDAQTISVRARSLRDTKRGITAVEFSQIYLIVGVLFPELVLLTGIAIWFRRRRS